MLTQPLTRPLTRKIHRAQLTSIRYRDFDPLSLEPYLLFDAESSMLGNLENPTLDLDASDNGSLDVITATRAGIATYTAADGQIVTADPNTVRVDHVQGEELTPTVYQHIGYTDFSSGWSTYLGSTALGDGYNGQASLVCSFTGSGQSYQNFTSVDGVTYTGSFWARAVSASGPYRLVHGNSASGSSTFITLTSEWQFFSIQFLGRSGGGSMYFGIGATAGDVVEIAMPQVEEGTTATDFVPNTTGSPKFIASATYGPRVPMMLIEPSATNLLDYSEDFSNSYWTKADTLIESNQIEAPDGTLTGSKLIEDGTDATHLLFRAGLTTLGTISIYAKKADENNRLFQIRRDGGSNSWSWFDLQAGTVEYQTNGVASIESVGNDWYRCSFTPTNSNGTIVFGLSNGGLGRGESWLGDGTSGVYMWGAQVETGSVATSYIPTSGGSVAERTRNADNLVIDGTAFSDFYNATEGTFYAESITRKSDGQPFIAEVDNGTNDRIFIYNDGVNVRAFLKTGGVTQANFAVGSRPAAGTLNRTAVSYQTDNILGSVNGGSVTSDTSATIPTSVNTLTLGSSYDLANTYALNGHIKRLIYWPTHSSSL